MKLSNTKKDKKLIDGVNESRSERFMDVDRMVNEGLGGGYVTEDNGLIEQTTTDTMNAPEFLFRKKKKS